MPTERTPYLLTLDTKISNWSLRYYHRQLSLFLYSKIPTDIEYLFYVEIGKSGNVHAHGWFESEVGYQSVVGTVLQQYRKRFGLYFHSRKKDVNKISSIGPEYDAYIVKDQSALAKLWKTSVAMLAITRMNGKGLWKQRQETQTKKALKKFKIQKALDADITIKCISGDIREMLVRKQEYKQSLEDPTMDVNNL